MESVEKIRELLDEVQISGALQSINIINGGYKNSCYLVTLCRGERFLLKVKFAGCSMGTLSKEVAAQKIVGCKTSVRVPEVLYAGSTSKIPELIILQTYLEGSNVSASLTSLSNEERREVSFRAGQCLGEIHSNCQSFRRDYLKYRPDAENWGDYIYEVFRNAFERCVDRNAIPAKLLDDIETCVSKWLPTISAAATISLVHRDFYLDNIILCTARRGPPNLGVIDFETASAWDSCWDFNRVRWWIFESYPDLERDFVEGYSTSADFSAVFDEAVRIYQLIEFLMLVGGGLNFCEFDVTEDLRVHCLRRKERK